jgi:hypothetical protein
MQIDAFSESLRLAEEYRGKSEGELRELAADFADLTEPAQQALRSELHSRGLGTPEEASANTAATFLATNAPASMKDADDNEDFDEQDDQTSGAHDYTWKTVLCARDEYEEAWQISEALRKAGIESWIERQGSKNVVPWAGEFMTGELQVLVAADQLEQAKAIAAQPIPQEIIDESKEEIPEYVEPKCPKCRAEDPTLEAVEPENHWHCEECGYDWSDPAEIAGKTPAN